MRKSTYTFLVIACLLLVLIWYWQTHLTYDGEVSHFEAKVRKEVNPAQLQAWANDLVMQCSTSKVAKVSFPVTAFPDYLKRLHHLPPYGFVIPTVPERQGYVLIMWGSGFRGHWGLHVGSTNYVDAYGSSVWEPGIYFWRENYQ